MGSSAHDWTWGFAKPTIKKEKKCWSKISKGWVTQMMIRCCWVCLKKVQNCSLSWSMDIHNVGPGPQVQPHWAPPTVLRWLGASSVNHTGPQKRNSPRRSPLPAASKEEKGGSTKTLRKGGKKGGGRGSITWATHEAADTVKTQNYFYSPTRNRTCSDGARRGWRWCLTRGTLTGSEGGAEIGDRERSRPSKGVVWGETTWGWEVVGGRQEGGVWKSLRVWG